MIADVEIMPEKSGDEQAIYDLTTIAFEPMAYSDGTEAPIIAKLRKDGDLTISLVALKAGDIIGHVAFSPVTIAGKNDGWFGLGPVSVHPDNQGLGIGSKLINEGLSQLKSEAAKGCALIGDPNYYHRFGFKSDGNLSYGEVPSHVLQWLSFGDAVAEGVLKFSPAFGE